MAYGHERVQRYWRHIKRVGPLAAVDGALLLGAYGVAYMVRMETLPPRWRLPPGVGPFLAGAVVVTVAALYVFGAYHRLWSQTSGHDVTVLVKGFGASSMVIVGVDAMLVPRPLPLSVGIVGSLLALMGSVAVRYRSRLVLGAARRWRAVVTFPVPEVRVLIVGAGAAGQATAWRLKYQAPRGSAYRVVGFVDDDPAKQGLYVEGTLVMGRREAIPALVVAHRVDLIVVAIHNVRAEEFHAILSLCERTQARIKIVPDVFALIRDTHGAPLLRDVQPEDLLGRPAVGWHEGVDVTAVQGKVVLVTGAAGSIGAELCRQILEYTPARLLVLDNNESGLHDLVIELQARVSPERLVPCLVDITDRPALRAVFEMHRPAVIFHSAAYKHVPMLEAHPQEALRVNVGGTQQVAGLARDFEVERFVLISTDKAVNPSSVMGASKRVCELLMHAMAEQGNHRTRFTSVRFGNVLGSRGSVVPTFTRQIDAGGPVTVTDPAMTRYFMTIPEAVNLVIHAACLTQGNDLFMLRMGQVVRIVELAERMIRLRGLRPYDDIAIQFVGVRPGEKINEELHTADEDERPTLHPAIVELVSWRNGIQPVSFLDQVNALCVRGLDPHRPALEQFCDLIAAGEAADKVGGQLLPGGTPYTIQTKSG